MSNSLDIRKLCDRLLDVISHEIVPKTRVGVSAGNKIFGAAILRKLDLSVVVAGTNDETRNPLLHGEIVTLNALFDLPSFNRPKIEDCLFLSTHEPCSLCLSAITWSGLDNFYYLFGYEKTRDAFNIPHDLKILEEVFKIPNGAYAQDNGFWSSYHIIDMVSEAKGKSADVLNKKVNQISKDYEVLSQSYQDVKNNYEIPLN